MILEKKTIGIKFLGLISSYGLSLFLWAVESQSEMEFIGLTINLKKVLQVQVDSGIVWLHPKIAHPLQVHRIIKLVSNLFLIFRFKQFW